MANSGTVTLTDCTISGNSAARRRRAVQRRHGDAHRLHDQRQLRRVRRRRGQLCRHGDARPTARSAATPPAAAAGCTTRPGDGDAHRHDRRGQYRAVSGASDIGGDTSVTGTYNLIGTGGSGGLVNGQNGNIVLTSLTDLGLAPLGDYGGPTQTMALLPGSPAIGTGIAVTRRHHRPARLRARLAQPDIGAFQSQTRWWSTPPIDGSRLAAGRPEPPPGGQPGQRHGRRRDDHLRPDRLRHARRSP